MENKEFKIYLMFAIVVPIVSFILKFLGMLSNELNIIIAISYLVVMGICYWRTN